MIEWRVAFLCSWWWQASTKDSSGLGLDKAPNRFHERSCLYIGNEGQRTYCLMVGRRPCASRSTAITLHLLTVEEPFVDQPL